MNKVSLKPDIIKLLNEHNINTGAWSLDEMEYFQERFDERMNEYLDTQTKFGLLEKTTKKLKDDTSKAILMSIVLEITLAEHERVEIESRNKLIASLETLCNERMRANANLTIQINNLKSEAADAENVLKKMFSRRLITKQSLSVKGLVQATFQYDGVPGEGQVALLLPYDIQKHLETIPALEGNVIVKAGNDNEEGKVFWVEFVNELKDNYTSIGVASVFGEGAVIIGS
jgi:hypothetical protein